MSLNLIDGVDEFKSYAKFSFKVLLSENVKDGLSSSFLLKKNSQLLLLKIFT